jgi:prepilin-type processing-associated H-X9-DG protein
MEVIVVVVLIMILAFLLRPNPPLHSDRRIHRILCAENLQKIGLAFGLWAGDNQGQFPGQNLTGLAFPHFQVMSNEIVTPKALYCPADISRTAATNFSTLTDMQISYFVGLDVSKDTPTAWLAGDRNLSANGSPIARGLVAITTNMLIGWQTNIHKVGGNVLLADGSVQQPSCQKLPALLMQSPFPTNRFAVP